MYRRILVLLILVSLFSQAIIVPNETHGQSQGVFSHIYTIYESSTGGDVYLGSTSTTLRVGLMYNGTVNASSIYGCITLPQGLTARTPCIAARNPSTGETARASPGDIVELTYTIDVSRNTTPGTYNAMLNLTYVLSGTTLIHSQLFNISLTIHKYPEPRLNIIDTYWSPGGYPGSNGVSLVVELENNGDSTLVSGTAVLYLPSGFDPAVARTSIMGLSPYSRTTLVYPNIMIYPDTQPGNYTAKIIIDAVYSTGDGVRYNKSITIYFNITVEEPPSTNIVLIDHGYTTTYPYPGTRYTRMYLTFQNLDNKIIETGIATITLENTVYENGSKRAITVFNGPIGYGDTFTIQTKKLIIPENTSMIIARIALNILVNDNGVEYWANNTYIVITDVPQPTYDIYVTEAYWANSRVYPGSTDETLNIIFYNAMDTTIRDAQIKIVFSSNVFSPSYKWSTPTTLQPGSYTTISINGIDIEPDARPGNYTCNIALHGVLLGGDGSFKNITLNYHIVVEVSEATIKPLKPVLIRWSTGKAYPNSLGAGIRLVLTPSTQLTILSGVLTLYMPPGISDSATGYGNKTIILENRISYGDYTAIDYTGLEITGITPGQYPFAVKARLLIDLGGAETWVNQTIVFTLPVAEPQLNLSIIESYWTTRIVTGNTSNTGINVLLQSYSTDTIESIHAVLRLPSGVEHGHGLNYAQWTSSTRVGFSEYFTMSFNELFINTNTSTLVFQLTVQAVLSRNGMVYNATGTYTFVLPLYNGTSPVKIVSVWYTYNGRPARLLPLSNGIDINIQLLNTWPETIETLIVEITDPSFLDFYRKTATCTNILGGSTCTITYHVDIPYALPGSYSIGLRISSIINSGGVLINVEQNKAITFIIDDPSKYSAVLGQLEAYWGTTTPTPVYPGETRAPLTIRLINLAQYTASDTIITLHPLDQSIRVLDNSKPCGDIGPGETCTITFYLDLRNTQPGKKAFKLTIDYYTRIYGSMYAFHTDLWFETDLPTPGSYLNGEPIVVTGSGWLNNWPVYPYSNKTVYTVTIANLYPYPVSSVHAKLILPTGFNESYPGSLEDYVPGLIQSLQEFTVSFTIDVGGVEPGTYTGYIEISLYLEAGPDGYRVEKTVPVTLVVDDPAKAIIVYQYGWLGGEPGLDAYGATYYVLIRNDEYPSMRGVLLELEAPEGIRFSQNNASRATYSPSAIIPSTSLSPTQGITPQQLLSLLQQEQVPVNPQLGIGDIASYMVKLNLHLREPGTYILRGTLDFIDHWGSREKINITIPVVVYGRPDLLSVEAPDMVVIVNGSAEYWVRVTNNYASRLMNVYIVLAPATPVLVPSDNLRYYPVIEPYSSINTTYTLYYNPIQVATGFATGFTTEFTGTSTGIFTIGIVYKDASGAISIYNTTLVVRIKPFIEIALSKETTLVYGDGRLRINGILINYGVSQAHSVEVLAIYNGGTASAFIGDMDPASQAAFRLEINAPYKPGEKTRIIVTYRDDYNTLYMKTYELAVAKKTEKTQPPPEISEVGDYRLIIIGIIVVFLLGVFYLIYRLYKQYSRRLETG